MSQRDDESRLRDMLEAARKAVAAVRGRTRDDLDRDEVLTAALERFAEIIGEAAGRVSTERRQALPKVPWAQIIGMRNRLIHAYMTVNRDILWKTVCDDLPALIRRLEAETAQ